jgi:glycosyltransferase involved in cell wall biosynthesis
VPSLTLCVIARDEERFLGECLKSGRDHVDEIVVVDTGSRDRTRAIAAEAGARIVDFAWCDDFSAARNVALDAARGTHVLVLDADERLVDPSRSLRRAATNPRFAIGLLAVHDATTLDSRSADVLSGRARLWNPCYVPRFFLRDPALRFTRRVHETITGDPLRLAAFLSAHNAVLQPLEAAIVHLGEVPALRAERGKRARNMRLLERGLADDPADGDLAGFLALELMRSGDAKVARALGEKHLWPFLAALRRLPAHIAKPSPVQLASVFATCLVQDGELRARARRAAREPRVLHRAASEPRVPEGAALERLGRNVGGAARVRALPRAARQALHDPRESGRDGSRLRGLRLANLALDRGRSARGARSAREPRELDRSVRVVGRAAARRSSPAGGRGRDRAGLHSNRSSGRSEVPPDLFALAALAAEALGSPDPALREAARRSERRKWLETRRLALVERQ